MGVARRDPCGDGIVLYIECIHVSILIVTLYYTFIRCY